MIRTLLAALLLASVSHAALAQWPVAKGDAARDKALTVPRFQEGQIVAPLARVTVFVRDMDTSLKYYREILKLEVVHDETMEGAAINKFLGTTGARLRTVILSPGDTAIGNVALNQIIGAKGEVVPPDRAGYGHTADFALVWPTRDIYAIHKAAVDGGWVAFNRPVTLMSRPNMAQQAVEMSIRDPDGFMVNLTQAGVPGTPTGGPGPEIMGTPENTTSEALMPRTEVPPSPVKYQEGQILGPMSRATTFVRNRDESLKLYRDILGLRQLMDNYWKGVGINRIKNTEGLEQRAAIFMAGLSNSGNIGIYQLYGEKITIPPPTKLTYVRPGDAGIVLVTRDIDSLHEKIKAGGYVIIAPPMALVADPSLKQQRLEMLFRDPDGTLVNLVQPGVPM